MNSFTHYRRRGGVPMVHDLSAAMWTDILSVRLCVYGAELETLGLCTSSAHSIRDAEHFM